MSVLTLTRECKPTAVKKLNYSRAYSYWYARLSDYLISLFDWKSLPFPQHELELRMQMNRQGYVGAVYAGKLGRWIVANGSGVGVTEYPDQWINYTWACPLDSGISEIGRSAVIFKNNSLMISSAFTIEHYAHLLAHNDLSLQAQLINSRTTGMSIAKDERAQKQMKRFYNALEDGATEVILSEDDLLSAEGDRIIDFLPTAGNASNILDFWQTSQNILKDFFTTIGVSKQTDKRERLIESEVEQEQPLYLFNIEDMLDVRKQAAEILSGLLGTEVSVDVAESLKRAQNPEKSAAPEQQAGEVKENENE